MKKFLKGRSSKNSTVDEDRNALFGGRAAPEQRRLSSDSTATRNTILPAYQEQSNGPARLDSYSKKTPAGNPYANDPYASTESASTSRRGAPVMNSRGTSSTIAQREELFRGVQPDRRLEPSNYGTAPEPVGEYGSNGEGIQTQEEEDEDVEGIKQEIRFVKQETLSSTRNALRLANEAEESGRATLTRLGEQSESLAETEKSLDLSKLANRDAQVKARELKNLNRSMFAIQANKPWGKNKRLEAEELRVRQQYEDDRDERDIREQGRKEVERRMDANLKSHAALAAKKTTRQKMGLAERSKYQFEADEDDDEIEGEIDENLDQMAAITGRLKGLAMATNAEVTRQNGQLERLTKKGQDVGDNLYMNTHRLKKIGEM